MNNYPILRAFLGGAITLAACAIALFFAHFKKATGDRLFGFFSAAFLLLGLEDVIREFAGEFKSSVYLIRLLAFLLIVYAIFDKNRGTKDRPNSRQR